MKSPIVVKLEGFLTIILRGSPHLGSKAIKQLNGHDNFSLKTFAADFCPLDQMQFI